MSPHNVHILMQRTKPAEKEFAQISDHCGVSFKQNGFNKNRLDGFLLLRSSVYEGLVELKCSQKYGTPIPWRP